MKAINVLSELKSTRLWCIGKSAHGSDLNLGDVHDAIAELIAADEEYDAARVAVWCDLGSKSVERYSRAQERRAAALLACKGQDHER